MYSNLNSAVSTWGRSICWLPPYTKHLLSWGQRPLSVQLVKFALTTPWLRFSTDVSDLVQVWGTRSGSKSCQSRDTGRGSELERVTSSHGAEQSPVSRTRSMDLCCMLLYLQVCALFLAAAVPCKESANPDAPPYWTSTVSWKYRAYNIDR